MPAGEPELPGPIRGEFADATTGFRGTAWWYTAEHMRTYGDARAEHARRERLANSELFEAASNYVNRYALDEAADDGDYITGCGEKQHRDAKRLLEAVRALARKEGTT